MPGALPPIMSRAERPPSCTGMERPSGRGTTASLYFPSPIRPRVGPLTTPPFAKAPRSPIPPTPVVAATIGPSAPMVAFSTVVDQPMILLPSSGAQARLEKSPYKPMAAPTSVIVPRRLICKSPLFPVVPRLKARPRFVGAINPSIRFLLLKAPNSPGVLLHLAPSSTGKVPPA